jgi:hypothetical protein
MEISPVSSASYPSAETEAPFAKAKPAFEALSRALESGNLSDARAAMAQLKKSLPPKAVRDGNPISKKMEALSKALETGDIKAAQTAFTDIQKTLMQKPAGESVKPTRPSGPPPGGAKGASGASGSPNKVYDKMDANKDGTVSYAEKIAYELKHPEATKAASTKPEETQVHLDTTA